jgi:nuclear pore complex protein Nup160
LCIGSHWEPTTYSDGAWTNSIRGLVKWQGQNSVRYNGRNLDFSTATAIATASDQTYVYTVSLNHTLKAWNLANRKLNVTKDLLNKPRNPQDASSLQLNPAESCFLRTFNAERAFSTDVARAGDRHYLATFSPHESGQFKFWAVKGGLTGPLIIEDLFPDEKFQPPDPDPMGNTIWNLADFDLKTSENGNRMELLVLWKNNTASQLNILAFDLNRLPQAWKSLWVGTAAETRDELGVVNASNVDPVDATESWLKYFFRPGRFSNAVLETSLSIYQDALRTVPKSQHLKGDRSLKERMCSTIASTVSLWKHPDSVMDYERYRTDTDSQWRQFWRIVEDVNKRKQEALSVVYDSFSDMPWVIQTGGCCVIRECSDTELFSSNDPKAVPDLEAVLHARLPNRGKLGKQAANLSSLIHIAATFRKHFPAELAQTCMIALDSELFQEPTLAPEARLLSFYEAANFAEHVNDDAFDSLSNAIETFGGYHQVLTRLFYQIMDTFPQNYEGGEGNLVSTSFGLRVMASGAEETILMNWKILFDLLVLVVFIEVEVHQAGEKMDKFDAPELFITLVDQLKEYEMMKWLAANSRQTTRDFSVRRASLGGETESHTVKMVQSLLEDPWAKDVKPLPASRETQSYVSTHTARELVSLMTRSGEATYEEAVVFNQCEMIRNGDLDLASDFLRFQPSNAWGTYIKGRLYLARNEFSVAAIHFQKAAYLLCESKFCFPIPGSKMLMWTQLMDTLSAGTLLRCPLTYLTSLMRTASTTACRNTTSTSLPSLSGPKPTHTPPTSPAWHSTRCPSRNLKLTVSKPNLFALMFLAGSSIPHSSPRRMTPRTPLSRFIPTWPSKNPPSQLS